MYSENKLVEPLLKMGPTAWFVFISTDFALARGTTEVGENAGDSPRPNAGSV